jgi:glycosyltransferase involved in cell wall biosynthesis
MRILWFTNMVMPPVEEYLGRRKEVLAGWMWALASQIAAQSDVELAIAASVPGVTAQRVSLNGIHHYILSQPAGRSYLPHSASDLRQALQVIDDFKPDLIHVHGTERFYGLVGTSQPSHVPVVISIQGILTPYVKYELAGLGLADILHLVRFRDLVRFKGPLFETLLNWRAGEREREIIRGNSHFIGRTDWDRAWVQAINPSAIYHFCDEALRSPFFERTWSIKKIKRHSILFTNAMSPRKGIPILLEALAILRQAIPDVHLILAGGWYPKSGWGRVVTRKIAALKLGANLTTAGRLTASELATMLERTHAFVSPSYIDNSPNSICESMVVGTPCVASFVGGVPTLISHGRTGLLVPPGDPAMLAATIRQVFENDELACKLSAEARGVARERHDPAKIVRRQLDIYSQVVGGHGNEEACCVMSSYIPDARLGV